MESQLRALLYQQLPQRAVAFNPVEPEPFDLVDLTRDVTNATRIYHRRTECVREALAGASLIVTDSQPLADAVKRVLPRAMVVALPFGGMNPHSGSGDEGGRMNKDSSLHPSSFIPHPFTVGLLNHTGEMEMNNRYALKLLKALDRELMVYGEALPGIEGEVKENYGEFAAMCDILLLPSLPGALNSTTLPLTMMAGKTAILAHNAPGYYGLAAATGVQLLPNDPATWRKTLEALETQPAKLRAMQERNLAFATRQNRESYARLASLASQFTAAPPPLREGCGCTKRVNSVTRLPSVVHGGGNTRRGAPIQPNQDPSSLEKESNL